MEEAGAILYRDAVIRSEKGLVSYTCSVNPTSPDEVERTNELTTDDFPLPSFPSQMSLRKGSRLQPHLSISLTRTLTLEAIHLPSQVPYANLLVQKRDTFVPPRLGQLRSPLPLNRLTCTSIPSLKGRQKSFITILTFIFPLLSPVHLELRATEILDPGLRNVVERRVLGGKRRSRGRGSSGGYWGVSHRGFEGRSGCS